MTKSKKNHQKQAIHGNEANVFDHELANEPLTAAEKQNNKKKKKKQ